MRTTHAHMHIHVSLTHVYVYEPTIATDSLLDNGVRNHKFTLESHAHVNREPLCRWAHVGGVPRKSTSIRRNSPP